jgi:hypothetical protein
MSKKKSAAEGDLSRIRPTLAQVGALFGVSGRWIGVLRSRGQLPADGATLGEFVAAWVVLRAPGESGE